MGINKLHPLLNSINFKKSKLISSYKEFLFKNLKQIKKIDRIMIHASSSFWSAISMLSCAKLGIHFTVIFEDLPLEAIKKRIEIFEPNIIFSSLKNINLSNYYFKKKQVKKIKVVHFQNIKLRNIRLVETNKKILSCDNFFSIFTSGSTGIQRVLHIVVGDFF